MFWLSTESVAQTVKAFEEYFMATDTLFIDIEGTDIEFVMSMDYSTVFEDAIIYYDRTTNKFYEFDLEGTFRRTYGRKGRGPGEYSGMGTTKFYRNDLLYLFDGGNKKFIDYDPDTPKDEFVIKEPVRDSEMADDGTILLYHPGPDQDEIATLYSIDGNKIGSAVRTTNVKLKILSYPFMLGGVTYDNERDMFLLHFPNERTLLEIDSQGQLKGKTLLKAEGSLKSCCNPVPDNVDPYNIGSDEVYDYLGSQQFVSFIEYLGNNTLLVSHQTSPAKAEFSSFYSLFDVNGTPIIEDIAHPEEMRFIGVHSDGVYMSDGEYILKYSLDKR